MSIAPHLVADFQAALRHHAAGNLDEAENRYRVILHDAPDTAEALHMLALIARARGNLELAADIVRRAVALAPHEARLRLGLADIVAATGEFQEAILSYRRAVELEPKLAIGWLGLGRMFAVVGEIEEAITCLRRAVELDGTLIAARRSLVAAGETDQIEPLTEALKQPGLSDAIRIDALFALGAALDAEGRYDAAFARVREANLLRREALAASGQGFDAAELRAFVDRRINACTPAFFARRIGQGCDSPVPVFVVGMPRSGTTLVERILASHSAVVGIGESNRIGSLLTQLGQSARSAAYCDWDPAEINRLATEYVAHLPHGGGRVKRVVDKTPDNLFHLGAIARLFPNARVIVCRRDPRDVCLSCYFQGFQLAMPYTTDLQDCAVRELEVERLMDHWRTSMPLPILDVQYEALVADPEYEVPRMLEFLRLAWEPGCLNFNHSAGAVTSASVWQVRRPLYTSSIGRWRHYERHLGKLLDIFGRD